MVTYVITVRRGSKNSGTKTFLHCFPKNGDKKDKLSNSLQWFKMVKSKPAPSKVSSRATPVPRFRPTGRTRERHRQPLYCVNWSNDVHVDEEGKKYYYLVTCGSLQVSIYEVEINNPKGSFDLVQSYRDEDKKEHFYACVYGGRSKYWGVKNSNRRVEESESDSSDDSKSPPLHASSEGLVGKKRPRSESSECLVFESNGTREKNFLQMQKGSSPRDRPQLLCVAGAAGFVKVIDPVQRLHVSCLKGHGSEIYDMKVSPANEMLLLSASVDESIRLWNLQSFACVAIFAGQHGHRQAILNVSWHPTGSQFASSGMDKSIRLWKIDGGKMKEAIQASYKTMPSGNRKSFHPRCEQFPYFATDKVHLNYVDCVHMLGDMVLSKSTYNSIVLWMPNLAGMSDNIIAEKAAYCPPSDVIALRTFDLNSCDIWFVRFAVDRMGRMLAVGNIEGEVDIWDIDSCKKKFTQTLKPMVGSTIRMVSFSPDGRTLVGCNDAASVCRWDAY